MGPSCGTKHGTRQWINLEPCGLLCGSITWFLIAYGMYATSFGVIIPWLGFSWFGIVNLLLFNGFSLLAFYAHIKTMTTDPGAVPKSARPLHNDTEERDYEQAENKIDTFKKFCRKCKAFKPQRAHHCSICGRCIVKMDHHCPWVNNCVGLGNHKLFLLFVFWIFVTCMYSLVLVLSKSFLCAARKDACGTASNQLVLIFLVVESVLFGLFTICMLGDQMSSLYSNQTQIDRLKNTKFAQQTEVNEVCGSAPHVTFQWSWLLPVAVSFKNPDLHERIHGFRTEEGEELSPLLLATAVSATPPVRGRKTLAGTMGGTDETCSDDSYGGDTISEWLQDVNAVSSDVSNHDGDVEMADIPAASMFQKLKVDSMDRSKSPSTSSSPSTGSAVANGEHANIRKRTNGA